MPSIIRRVFALVFCFASLPLLAIEIAAQSENASPQVVTAAESSTRLRRASASMTASGASVLSTDPVIISTAEEEEEAPTIVSAARQSSFRLLSPAPYEQMLLAAIDMRIGAPYVWGASGPRTFDCSGFVWSVFRSAGFDLERTNARTLWAHSSPAGGAERYRFGTLVFFNNQQHVGIVADDRGFYHASRSQGVTYSTFDGYWGERIDGFRKLATLEAE